MKIKKYAFLVLLVLLLVIIIIVGSLALLDCMFSGRLISSKSMISTTLEWGRLAPFPDSKSNFIIKAGGSPFTREFNASFNLPKDDLIKWIKDSPGLQDAEVSNIDEFTKEYRIKPGGGAMFAEVIINFKENSIRIKTYWS